MAVVITAGAVDLDREGRDPAYVESIVKRSQKIVDKLELTESPLPGTRTAKRRIFRGLSERNRKASGIRTRPYFVSSSSFRSRLLP